MASSILILTDREREREREREKERERERERKRERENERDKESFLKFQLSSHNEFLYILWLKPTKKLNRQGGKLILNFKVLPQLRRMVMFRI